MDSRSGGDDTVLTSRVHVPDHVVYRDFAEETVILNLDSGTYHSLNSTATRMLEVLTASDSVGAAVEELTREYEQPADRIERDVLDLCRALSDRGLIEQDAGRTD
jgi:coenzyme PQQ synthesis protein D (PqqD)